MDDGRPARWLWELASLGLPGGPGPGPPPSGLRSLLGPVGHHRLTGVLAAAVADGTVPTGDEDRAAVEAAHEAAMREALLLEDMLLEGVAVLATAGIEPLVLKGSAFAHVVHPDPAQRCFGDIDLLVRSEEIDAAVDALIAAGGRRPAPELAPGFDRRFAKAVTLRWHGGTEMDLHRTLAAGPYGFLVDLTELFAVPAHFRLAGRQLRTLEPDHQLLHAALHLSLGDVDVRLGHVRDLALLCRHPSVDAERVLAGAGRWGIEAPVADGLRHVGRLGLPATRLEDWAAGFTPGRRDRVRMSAYRRRRGRYRRQALASLPVLGRTERVAFLRALLARRRG